MGEIQRGIKKLGAEEKKRALRAHPRLDIEHPCG